jgi:hypothetical protein
MNRTIDQGCSHAQAISKIQMAHRRCLGDSDNGAVAIMGAQQALLCRRHLHAHQAKCSLCQELMASTYGQPRNDEACQPCA